MSFPDFLSEEAELVAKKLLGCTLERTIGDSRIKVKIVETESYDQFDEASHSFKSRSPRNEIMFGPSGYLYVYFTYGMHYCCNVVCGPNGIGQAVLIRAVEPISGFEILQNNRPNQSLYNQTNGPAKLCQALAIDKRLNTHNLRLSPLVLSTNQQISENQIVISKRVGISKAKDELKRFYIKDNRFISKK